VSRAVRTYGVRRWPQWDLSNPQGGRGVARVRALPVSVKQFLGAGGFPAAERCDGPDRDVALLGLVTVRILVTGAAGMLGRKLAERLVRDGVLGGVRVSHVSLADVVAAPRPAASSFELEMLVADLAESGVAGALVGGRPDVIFHLAGVVSGEAETDLEKGYRVNLDGMRLLLEAVRQTGVGYRPRVVFSSSIAVFGAPLPELIDDQQRTTPLTSYGTQKAICELLLSDYTRRGFLDGVALRLPTICVRPGAPNRAASGFFSNIIQEPLSGREAVLPVTDDLRHWFASPRAAVTGLLHAATLESGSFGDWRSITLPGVAATVAEQIAALRSVAGEEAVRLIRREPDPAIMGIVAGWPRSFDARRARALGFHGEADFEEIIRVYIDDELGGQIGRSCP
jgi:nucleoside-diphosphate-sugar epimerase